MKKLILTTFSIMLMSLLFGQKSKPEPNGFANYKEFKNDQPSLFFEFEMKQRTGGDIFMTGGIPNYKPRKVKKEEDLNIIEMQVWGLKVGDAVYINSYPYSGFRNYNLILGKGYYTYFIGEPAKFVNEQRELGIVPPDGKQIQVCCQCGYVILPDGSVRLLKPSLLEWLCNDNEVLLKEIQEARLKLENVNQMFAFLKRYNESKK